MIGTDEGLRRMAELLQPVEIRLGDQEFEVEPPTVRQAVEIRATLLSATQGSEADTATLLDLLDSWLPADLAAALRRMEAARALQLVSHLLDTQIRRFIRDSATKPEADEDGQDGGFDIRLALSDYCQVMGGDPWRVYNETPWPFFVVMTLARETAAARHLLRLSEIEILPHTGQAARAALASLRRRATGQLAHEEPYCAPREVIERDRAELRKMMRGEG